MLPVFLRQQLEFKIYVIEQSRNKIFNRAKLLNIGFEIARNQSKNDGSNRPFECYFFHDVDLILENDENIYECLSFETYSKNVNQIDDATFHSSKFQLKHSPPPQIASHFLTGWSKYNYHMKYSTFFGGIIGLTEETMVNINGFSNLFFGWGGEDDNVLHRINNFNKKVARNNKSEFYGQKSEILVYRPNTRLGRYKMIPHIHEAGNKINTHRKQDMREIVKISETDGLNSLEFTIVKSYLSDIYEKITVEI